MWRLYNKSSTSLNSSGREFHKQGPATQNALSLIIISTFSWDKVFKWLCLSFLGGWSPKPLRRMTQFSQIGHIYTWHCIDGWLKIFPIKLVVQSHSLVKGLQLLLFRCFGFWCGFFCGGGSDDHIVSFLISFGANPKSPYRTKSTLFRHRP